jgi:hypothetical protein
MKNVKIILLVIFLLACAAVNAYTILSDDSGDDLAGMLLFFPALAMSKPSFTGYTEADIVEFANMIASFKHGKCYIADGTITKTEANAIFADLTTMATELASNTVELSDLADSPGKEESKVEKLATSNYEIEGKRTNTIELNLVGISQDRKDWLEKQLNSAARTVILVSTDGTNAFVFTGRRWTYERTNEIGKLSNATIGTKYNGATGNVYFIYRNIQPAA